ncbi:putative polyvalent protein kinase domain-containing protein [Flavitalea flava]
MFSNDTRKRLENIVRGIIIEGAEDTCTATRNYLCASFSTSTTVKRDFESQSIVKKEQQEFLKHYSDKNNLWFYDLPDESRYLARGGEARIYLDVDSRSVIKLNEAIYYATWLEFFNSLVIHNLLFKNSTYTFLGLTEQNNSFQAVLKQPFVTSDAPVDLSEVRRLLSNNGFENTRRNDYFNKDLGLILEDIHDENVIVNKGNFFFIDTVFYTVSGNQ